MNKMKYIVFFLLFFPNYIYGQKKLIPIGDIFIPIYDIKTEKNIPIKDDIVEVDSPTQLGLTATGLYNSDLVISENTYPIQAGYLSGQNAQYFSFLYTPGIQFSGPRPWQIYSNINFNVFYQFKIGTDFPNSENKFEDSFFDDDFNKKIRSSILLMLWVLKVHKKSLLDCSFAAGDMKQAGVFKNAHKENGIYSTREKIVKVFDKIIGSPMAIGAKSMKDKNDFRLGSAYAYNQEVEPYLTMLDLYTHRPEKYERPSLIAATIFHEALHNFGFKHYDESSLSDRDLDKNGFKDLASDYKDKNIAINALGTCMSNIISHTGIYAKKCHYIYNDSSPSWVCYDPDTKETSSTEVCEIERDTCLSYPLAHADYEVCLSEKDTEISFSDELEDKTANKYVLYYSDGKVFKEGKGVLTDRGPK